MKFSDEECNKFFIKCTRNYLMDMNKGYLNEVESTKKEMRNGTQVPKKSKVTETE